MSFEPFKEDLVPKFMASGEHKFYKSILVMALYKLMVMEQGSYEGTPPHIEYMNFCDKFIILYRREGNEVYLNIAKMFRKAAHKIYRIMLKRKLTTHNSKFLTLVEYGRN